MTEYTKFGKVVVNGKKKIVYHKKGSTKNYVAYKGRHIGLAKYKKIMAKKLMKKMKGGGGEEPPFLTSMINKMMGGKIKKVKKSGKKKGKKSGKKTKKI